MPIVRHRSAVLLSLLACLCLIGCGSSDEANQESTNATTPFDGGLAAHRPLYDALLAEIAKFGKDVQLAPKKGYVSLRLRRQFAMIQPSASGLNRPANCRRPTCLIEMTGRSSLQQGLRSAR